MTGGDGATSEPTACMACGRPLLDEESKRLRLGPRCRRRLAGLLAPRPRRRLRYPPNHPKATPPPAVHGALELWDDEDDDQADDGSYAIQDVPLTGSYL
ncbi:DUF6011 domain-containing protein [Streptomyces sp. NPDC096311]|uniref:DUF6011 domain-containing protein n=1 Tax=Streptomyces sp. NPDC096311 TaxID=3366083 RepID=UPI003817F638